MSNSATKQTRPLSPNLQIYRPQLTSVLSIGNRLTGITLSVYAVALVVWLIAAAAGPQAYSTVLVFVHSWVGQIFLLGCTFSFFFHLFGGIRHLVWDAGYGFDLRAIYASGWLVVVASVFLTVVSLMTSLIVAR
jgi:succinate dehydrogenase / fumarate reductase cytochrome b subunit